ncbi:MAG: peptidoglycan editing factor PgeF [Deltaproteobacteria bacterium]|nr:peptidoglycan editing factor PgeF [Deltaproteobacteria bacterium]
MLTTLTFPQFSRCSTLFHAIFNRHGGASLPPFDMLNVSYGVNDAWQSVTTNRQLIKKNLGIDLLVSGKQVHGATIHLVATKPDSDLEITGCDAFISSIAGVGLMIQQADCQAVMLFDPSRQVVANIHCGWRGSVENIIGGTISAMQRCFHTEPADLLAAISPSLGPCCAEFVNYRTELPDHFHPFQVKPRYFDFWAISRQQLAQAGVLQDNISTASICTVCNPEWFSYRRDGNTGRFCTIIGLKP